MAEALPHPSGSLQPTIKPTFPGSMLELEITPEKPQNKEFNKVIARECKKRVAFSEDLNRVYSDQQVIDNKTKCQQNQQHQYPR